MPATGTSTPWFRTSGTWVQGTDDSYNFPGGFMQRWPFNFDQGGPSNIERWRVTAPAGLTNVHELLRVRFYGVVKLGGAVGTSIQAFVNGTAVGSPWAHAIGSGDPLDFGYDSGQLWLPVPPAGASPQIEVACTFTTGNGLLRWKTLYVDWMADVPVAAPYWGILV